DIPRRRHRANGERGARTRVRTPDGLGYSAHPARRFGRMYCSAAAALTAFKLAASQTKRWPVRSATLPSRRASVTTPENAKFAPGLVLPPRQASSHSRSLPGDRGSVLGGCL